MMINLGKKKKTQTRKSVKYIGNKYVRRFMFIFESCNISAIIRFKMKTPEKHIKTQFY